MLSDLLRPFAYLTITHSGRLPVWVNWLLPSGAALVISLVVWWFDVPLILFGGDGLLNRLQGFVQTLVGFYIAALAAVSSFNSPHLDKIMPAPAPIMRIKYCGGMEAIQLTRRRFLCSMFAYLTALSFIFSLCSIVVLSIPVAAVAGLGVETALYLKALALFFVLMPFLQLTLVTMWGLFYLGERMLTPD